MKIYTRRGDGGETGLYGGDRVRKDAPRVEAYGAVDELNSAIGVAAAQTTHADVRELCRGIQNELFDIGAELATPPRRKKNAALELDAVQVLENAIDKYEGELPPLRRFILPGGTNAAAAFHFARTVCRRAERRCVALAAAAEQKAAAQERAALRYLNRLSDLLFVLARVENARANTPDVEWQSGTS